MKKAAIAFVSVTAGFLLLLAGVFIGRSTSDLFVYVHPEKTATVVIPEEDVFKLDLNTVTLNQLVEIPGIGETIAQRILDYRKEHGPFSSIDELLNVYGIGEARLEQLSEYLTVGGK